MWGFEGTRGLANFTSEKVEKENKSHGTTDYKTVFGITGTKHCEQKDKPIIVFKHVKRSYRALDLTIHEELRRSTGVKLGMRTILLTSCIWVTEC